MPDPNGRSDPQAPLPSASISVDEETDQAARFATVLRSLKGCPHGKFSEESTCRQVVSALQQLRPSDISHQLHTEDIPRAVREYELLELIGTGGMGAVFKAWHGALNRFAAVKVLRPEIAARKGAVERFKREMQAIGQLEHKHIVRAFDAGEDNGTLFLAMEYVKGVSGAKLLTQRQRPLEIDAACRIIQQAALGLAYVHHNKVIHRDVKPSNIMLDEDGQVRLLDLGLACFEDSQDGELTSEGQAIGTPAYASPEQLRDSRCVDERTDIYSLGASFYKLLTGRVPFSAGQTTLTGQAMEMATKEITPVRELRPEVPKKLANLVHQMLDKSPQRRPGSAGIVAEQLSAFTTTEVQKRTPNWVNVRPLIVLVIATLLAGTVTMWRLQVPLGTHASMSRSDSWSDSGQENVVDNSEASRLAEVPTRPRHQDENPPTKAAQRTPIAEGLAHVLAPNEGIFDYSVRPNLGFGTYGVVIGRALQTVDVAPSGKYYAFTTSYDVRVVETISGRVALAFPRAKWRWFSVRFSPDETRLALQTLSGHRISVRGLAGRLLHEWAPPVDDAGRWPTGLQWTPNGEHLLLWGAHEAFLMTPDGSVVRSVEFESPDKGPSRDWEEGRCCLATAAGIHPNGNVAAFGCADGTIRYWPLDGHDLRGLRSQQAHNGAVLGIAWDPFGSRLVSCGADRAMNFWDADGTIIKTVENIELAGSAKMIASPTVAWSPDGQHVVDSLGVVRDGAGEVTMRFDRTALASNQMWLPYWTDTEISLVSVKSNAFTDGEVNGHLAVYTPDGRRLIQRNTPFPLSPVSATILPTGGIRAAYTLSGSEVVIRDWAKTGQPIASDRRQVSFVAGGMRWNSGRSEIGVATQDTHFFDSKGSMSRELKGVVWSDWSPSGKFLLTAETRSSTSEGPKLRIRSRTGQIVRDLQCDITNFHAKYAQPRWSPHGRFVAAVVDTGLAGQPSFVLHLWRVEDPVAPLHSVPLQGVPDCMSWSPDGKHVVVSDLVLDYPHHGESTLLCLERDTGKTSSIKKSPPADTELCLRRHIWANSSQFYWLGSMYRVTASSELELASEYVRKEGMDSYVIRRFPIPSTDLFLDFRRKQVEFQDGTIAAPLNFAGEPAVACRPGERGVVHANGKLLIRSLRAQTATAVSLSPVDLKTRRVQWSGLSFSDGTAITLQPAGEVLFGPEDVDRYLTWIVRYRGGREIPLTKKRFLSRIGLDEPRQAMNWVLDLGGELVVEGLKEPIRRRDVRYVDDLPNVDAVTGIKLDRVRLIADGALGRVRTLPNVRDLDLSASHIKTLPDLSSLDSLQRVILSNSTVASIASIANLRQIRVLSLDGTPISVDVGATLRTLTGLEELDLGNTSIAEFVLPDIAELENLRLLRLADTVSEAAISRFSEANPDCRIEFQ